MEREREKIEKERKEREEELERARLEYQRTETERLEREIQEQVRLERQRTEERRLNAEKDRLEKERLERLGRENELRARTERQLAEKEGAREREAIEQHQQLEIVTVGAGKVEDSHSFSPSLEDSAGQKKFLESERQLQLREEALRRKEESLAEREKACNGREDALGEKEEELKQVHEKLKKCKQRLRVSRSLADGLREDLEMARKEIAAKDSILESSRHLVAAHSGNARNRDDEEDVISQLRQANHAHQTQNSFLSSEVRAQVWWLSPDSAINNQKIKRLEREFNIDMAAKKETITKLQREAEAAKKQYQDLRNHTLLKQGNEALSEEFSRLKKQCVQLPPSSQHQFFIYGLTARYHQILLCFGGGFKT